MKKLPILILLLLSGCTWTKNGKLVKMADGTIYRLEQGPAHENYTLNKVSTGEFDSLRSKLISSGSLGIGDPYPQPKLDIQGTIIKNK